MGHSEKTKAILRERALEQFRTKGHPRLGAVLSEEHKRKISESVKKNWAGGYPKGKSNPKLSEVRKKMYREGKPMGVFKKGNQYWDNENTKKTQFKPLDGHPEWKGGSSFKPYPKEFSVRLKKKILKLHNYSCSTCGHDGKERRLEVHHKDKDKTNNKESNLTVLCRTCHNKLHKFGKYKRRSENSS